MDKNKKCKDCNKRLQHNNKTGYCYLCEIKYQVCKICGKKISACAFRRTGLCHSCGCAKQEKTKNENTCKNCNRSLHTNNKSGYCRDCMTNLAICKKCGKKTSIGSFRNTGLCQKCAVRETQRKRKLPDEFCRKCGIKLKTKNRTKTHCCVVCSDHKHVIGRIYSNKNMSNIYYQSSYEKRFIELIEQDDNIKAYYRPKFEIRYSLDGLKIKRYYPDFILEYFDDCREMIEVKPLKLINDEKVLAKAKAATEFCNENNMRYRIVTEKDLFKESI